MSKADIFAKLPKLTAGTSAAIRSWSLRYYPSTRSASSPISGPANSSGALTAKFKSGWRMRLWLRGG